MQPLSAKAYTQISNVLDLPTLASHKHSPHPLKSFYCPPSRPILPHSSSFYLLGKHSSQGSMLSLAPQPESGRPEAQWGWTSELAVSRLPQTHGPTAEIRPGPGKMRGSLRVRRAQEVGSHPWRKGICIPGPRQHGAQWFFPEDVDWDLGDPPGSQGHGHKGAGLPPHHVTPPLCCLGCWVTLWWLWIARCFHSCCYYYFFL